MGFDAKVAKTSTYPVMCQFPLFVALQDQKTEFTNVTDRQTDRRTDGRHMARHVALKTKRSSTKKLSLDVVNLLRT